jgi:transposase-like protein
MVLKLIACPTCQHTEVVKHGQTSDGKQRFLCQNPECARHTFLLDYVYKGRIPDVKQQIVDMTMNGSGIRDIARVLHISPTTVIDTLKKRTGHSSSESYALVAITARTIPGDH